MHQVLSRIGTLTAMSQVIVELMDSRVPRESVMNYDEGNGALNILLVENRHDRPGLVRRALINGNIAGRLHSVGDTAEALAYLRRDAPYFAAPRADFVLLGRCLTQDGGCDILNELERNAEFQATRLIVIDDGTSSTGDKEIWPDDCCGPKQVPLKDLAEEISRKEIGASSFVRKLMRL